IAMLAVLKAGGAYVPVDTQYPQERIAYIFQDARCKVVIDHTLLEDFKHTRSLYNSGNPLRCLHPFHLAYVIYTSGSTGKPKGVMIEHAALANYLQAIKAEYGVTSRDKVLQVSNIAFDAATEQVWLALTSGAALYLIDHVTLIDNDALSHFLVKHGITHIHAVPAILKNIHLPQGHALKRVISAGESCPAALP